MHNHRLECTVFIGSMWRRYAGFVSAEDGLAWVNQLSIKLGPRSLI